jgi:quinol monooxygenase YgiN
MFVRNVSINMKANSVAEFTKILDDQVIPMLRKHPGFCDEVAFVNENGTHVTSISTWETREQADAYQASGYGEALKCLASVIDGTPKVRTSNVINSTLHAPVALPTA